MHDVSGGRLVGLAHITIAIGSVAHHADLARVCTGSLAAARSLQDLRALIFCDHALELHQELIFSAVALRRLHKQRLDSVAGELFDQQNLVCVLAALKRSGEYASTTWICPSAARSRTRSKPGLSNIAPL